MKMIVRLMMVLALVGTAKIAFAGSNLQSLKAMFNNMVVKKDIALMSTYYDPQFKLYSNGKTMGYQQFYQDHEKVYKTPIQYSIKFDKSTLIQRGDKIAARVFITTKLPAQKATKIEVILIAQYRHSKIYRLWELTYPNWAKMKAFKSFVK